MTAALDFAMLPPEVNSGRMYSGAGSGPMLAAASAWHGLAAELRLTATGYSSVLSELTGQAWHGPSSATMTAAVAPYVAWLSTTATQAEETAAQAEAAVAAYEAAFAATVPPPVIAANRAQLMVLVATNFLGQNTPAIAATEALYMEMWAQDAAAMYGYAGSTAAASQLTSFTQPEQVAIATAPTAQAAAVTEAAATQAGTGQGTLSQLLSTLPGALQSLAFAGSSGSGLSGVLDGFNIFAPGSGSSTTGLSGMLSVFSGANGSAFGDFLNSQVLNSVFASGFYMPARYLGNTSDFMGLAGKGADAAGVPGPAANAPESPLGGVGALGDSAGLGRAGLVGPLSVPPSWATPAPLHSPLSATLGAAPLETPSPAVAASTPPMPLANMAAQGEGRAVPQYGFRPSFVARPPAAG
ncbi:MAG: PPE family protein [Mycobacterium sp.]|uniref:PPE family protein n=1 Tax=Mycobacterium sp. TaxID=1785 RepID=UPI003C5F34B1